MVSLPECAALWQVAQCAFASASLGAAGALNACKCVCHRTDRRRNVRGEVGLFNGAQVAAARARQRHHAACKYVQALMMRSE